MNSSSLAINQKQISCINLIAVYLTIFLIVFTGVLSAAVISTNNFQKSIVIKNGTIPQPILPLGPPVRDVDDDEVSTPFPLDEEDLARIQSSSRITTTTTPITTTTLKVMTTRTPETTTKRFNVIQRLLKALLGPSQYHKIVLGPVGAVITGESLFRMPGIKQFSGRDTPLAVVNPYLDDIYPTTTKSPY